ncbi:MAG: VCBS repeat-containing protein [Acidobacteria bacterium]|nr:VCBS repeat-containing protein [Acidobacteriota bacterium]
MDTTVSADYDGDGRADIAVYRSGNGRWYLQNSTAGFSTAQWGIGADFPSPADYDGDGKADIAVFRQAEGIWYIQQIPKRRAVRITTLLPDADCHQFLLGERRSVRRHEGFQFPPRLIRLRQDRSRPPGCFHLHG